jgi:hypothetical protein
MRDRSAHRCGIERGCVHHRLELPFESFDLLCQLVQLVLGVVARLEHEFQRGPRTRRLAW